jgi:hypothetical protein
MGVFFYVFFGVGTVAGFNIGGLLGESINSKSNLRYVASAYLTTHPQACKLLVLASLLASCWHSL